MNRVSAAAALIAAVLASVALQGETAVDCVQVDVALEPCLSYLRGQGSTDPPQRCCDGLRRVEGLAVTKADRVQACTCVKDAASKFSDIKDDVARGLPDKCGVQLSIPVSRNVDCSTIE